MNALRYIARIGIVAARKREYLSERAWLLILKYENNWKDQVIANVHGVSRAYVRAEIDKGHSYLNGVMDAIIY